MTKTSFLVVYDYGQGGVWAFVEATSKDDLLRRFPELQVFDSQPSWMSESEVTRIRRTSTYDIDRPAGLLRDLIAQRKDSQAGTG